MLAQLKGALQVLTSMNMKSSVSAALIGDPGVGKTALLTRYAKPLAPVSKLSPTTCDGFRVDLFVDSEAVSVSVHDVGGSDSMEPLQTLTLGLANVVLVCFDVTNRNSLQSVALKWVPKIRQCCARDVKILLVGLQKDKRRDIRVLARLQQMGDEPITEGEGRRMARLLSCDGYAECSVFETPHSKPADLKTVFDTAVQLVLQPTLLQMPVRSRWSRFCEWYRNITASCRRPCARSPDYQTLLLE